MEDIESSNSSNAGLPTGRINNKKRNQKKPKKLAPLDVDGQLSSKQNQMTTKVKAIHHKRDLIEAVRKVAPASVQLSPTLFHDIAANLKTIAIDDSDVRQQLSIVEDGVNNAARRYNDLRVLCDRRATELKEKLDELDALKLDHDAMESMKHRNTFEAQRIDQLKEEIEQVENDIIRSQHYRRQLEHMLNRLKQNQIKFDAHMNGMEETYHAVKHEWEECRLMKRNLDSGLSRAELVYEECAERVRILRHERKIMLETRKDELKNAHRLKRWLRERAVTKMALATELRGDLTKEEELLLRTQLKEKEEKTKRLQRANEESQRKVSALDEAFTKIKQITGMRSMEDMLEKFSAQKANKKNLEKEVQEVEARLSEAKKMNARAELAFQERKSSGVGEFENNKESTSAIEEKIQAARNEYKITKAASDRLHSVLVALQQGSHGLLQRVQPYLTLVDAGVFELTSLNLGGDDVEAWAETMDALNTSEQVLSKMLELIGGGDGAPTKIGAGGLDPIIDASDSVSTEAPSMTHNIRIRSRKVKRDAEDSEYFGGPVTRSAPDDASLTDSESSFDAEGTSPLLQQQLLQDEKSSPNGLNIHSLDEELMNRNELKRISVKLSVDATKKQKEESRSKKLAERLVTQVDGDESGLANMAKYKAQQTSSSRLSVHHHPPTLPSTVTLRDDPMTKTQAFLTCMPNLK
mmetsp:Transcript_13135/g.13597  ORF Transcript_13135/g.13597 Transcript_13135/m.13597 type:complete len:695 (+) Transcript_13135:27-2111(+)